MVNIGLASIRLQNVQLREDLLLDEVQLDGSGIHLEAPERADDTGRARAEATKFRVAISEPNLNRFVEANLPADAPVRNLRVALFTGKAQVKGNLVKSVMSLPFSLEATLQIENGVRVKLDCKASSVGGIGLPAAAVDLIEKYLNEKLALDLREAPIAVWLEELRCEPGRLTAIGKARIVWPPEALPATPIPPFSARELPEKEENIASSASSLS